MPFIWVKTSSAEGNAFSSPEETWSGHWSASLLPVSCEAPELFTPSTSEPTMKLALGLSTNCKNASWSADPEGLPVQSVPASLLEKTRPSDARIDAALPENLKPTKSGGERSGAFPGDFPAGLGT